MPAWHQPGQPLRAARPGQHAQLHLRHAQPGLGFRDPQVAGQGQLQATAEGHPVQRRDRRLRAVRDQLVDLGHRGDEAAERAGVGERLDLGEVSPGTERAARAGDDQRPHPLVGGRRRDRGGQQAEQVAADGVEAAGTVEGEHGHLTVRLGEKFRLHCAGLHRLDSQAMVRPPLTDSVWPVM